MQHQPPLNHSWQSTLTTVSLQKLIVELDEHDQESLLGGSFTGEDFLRSRLTAKNVEEISVSFPRSIPTLLM